MYWLLSYTLAEDYLERRQPWRQAHLDHLHQYHRSGNLLMAGALSDRYDGAVLLFESDDSSTIERFIAEDPFVRAALVTNWSIRPWSTVMWGDDQLPNAL